MVSHILGGIAAMIQLDKVVLGYQNTPLTPPISGRFEPGSLTAIVGENGVGKSTLIQALTQGNTQLSGQIHYAKARENLMACLPQHAHLDRSFPIRVFDVVAMGCWPQTGLFRALKGVQSARVHQALVKTGIERLANNTIDTLSGGQFQRMLFARLLVQDAPVMIMDEPFVGIDCQTRQALMTLIEQLNQGGKTLIVVLHDMEMVEAFFPNLLMLKQDLVQWGKTATLLPHYGHTSTMGTPSPLVNPGEQKLELARP
ncbi:MULTISPECIES: metal ABC transporter ATP-binding protein [unclassified Vibrio]|uniref:ABC transporter ATP-binding protein n=1 Tax=Vibrio sp. HB236076 TaxID=3232307 RepID=A0AB39HIZ8_9VIBR|nr:ABC transporter ATP-binding protein [Vibrio sp. HB161653]MDP5252875.1 ABC transporter ATP-binding protein [Vibrio sp. HB161653]